MIGMGAKLGEVTISRAPCLNRLSALRIAEGVLEAVENGHTDFGKRIFS